jgi:hypothetical protein
MPLLEISYLIKQREKGKAGDVPADVVPGVNPLPALYHFRCQLSAHAHRGHAVADGNLQEESGIFFK